MEYSLENIALDKNYSEWNIMNLDTNTQKRCSYRVHVKRLFNVIIYIFNNPLTTYLYIS